MVHKGTVTEYPLNTPAHRFKYHCDGCQWQSHQETRESAEAIGAQHREQFGYVHPIEPSELAKESKPLVAEKPVYDFTRTSTSTPAVVEEV